MTLRSLLREPLLHFLVLGALLFALDAWLRAPVAATSTPEIAVGEARINNLVQTFRRTWQRPPTRSELDGLVEDHIREEMLYREALALGLDRDDTIIRRRLRQKMEFITDEAAALAPPSARDLETYLAAHADDFRVEPRASFAQVFLDPGRRAKTLEADAKRLLDELNRPGAAADLARHGDKLQMLESRYVDAGPREVARVFGAAFAEELYRQPAGRWTGPLRSGYGMHLVRIDTLVPGGIAALDTVRPRVEREWSNARRKELQEAYYAHLRGKYKVTVSMPGAGAPSPGKP